MKVADIIIRMHGKDPNSIITTVINDLEKRDYNKAESNMWLLYRDGYWYENEIETDHVIQTIERSR